MTANAASLTTLHIIITHEELFLVRSASATWREFQEQYAGFMTSLGPMDVEGVLETFATEWPDLVEACAPAIRNFASVARDGEALRFA